MENRQQTLLKIAEDLKLSKTTVSVCLSGNAKKGRVKPETVERVKKYAEKINYIPNRIARSLTKPGQSPVGLIICKNRFSEKSLSALLKAMRMLDANGREFIVQHFLPNHLDDTIVALKGMNVQKIIMFDLFDQNTLHGATPNRLITLFKDMQFYSVDYNFSVQENYFREIYCLGVNRSDIYTKLFIALFKAGETPVACDVNCISAKTRHQLASSGFEIKPEHIMVMPDNVDGNFFKVGNELVPQVIAMIKTDSIRTVVLRDDKIAAGLIDGIMANGYSVPGDISVIGFDNIEAAPYFKVPLTTIELPVIGNTEKVVESILSGKDIPAIIESELKIIWRDSARRLNGV